MNWVDYLLILVIIGSIASGLAEGFVSMAIGFFALILGFLAASWFYGVPAEWLQPMFKSESAASLIGFGIIFVGTMAAGAVLAWIVQRVFKVVGLTWIDRLAGGAFGVVRGLIILSVGALALTTFFPTKIPNAVSKSRYAPYVFNASDVLADVTPYPIRAGFEKGYEEIKQLIKELRPKPARTEPANAERI